VRAAIRDEPFTVERDGVAIDVGHVLRRRDRVFEWLSLDRWNVIVADSIVATSRDVHEVVDVDGARWTFRPVAPEDHRLMFPTTDIAPDDLAQWLRDRAPKVP
jgi:hypothetical protein